MLALISSCQQNLTYDKPLIVWNITGCYCGANDKPACKYTLRYAGVFKEELYLIDTCGKYDVGDTLFVYKKR